MANEPVIDAGAPADGGDKGVVDVPKWLSSVPENFKENDYLKGFATIGDAVERLVNNEVALKNAIARPAEGATDEEKATFRANVAKLAGIELPDSADKYQLTKPEKLPDSAYSAETEKVWRDRFMAAGVSTTAASKIWQDFHGDIEAAITAQQTAQNQAIEAATKSLKSDWGAKFDENIELAKRGFREFAGDKADALLAKYPGIANDPDFVKLSLHHQNRVSDDNLALGSEKGVTGVGDKTPAQRAREVYPNMPKGDD